MTEFMEVLQDGLEMVELIREIAGEIGAGIVCMFGLIAVVVGLIKAFYGLKLFKLQFMGFTGTILSVVFIILVVISGSISGGAIMLALLVGLIGGCYLGYKFYKTGMYFYASLLCGTIFAAFTLRLGFGVAVLFMVLGFIVGTVFVKKYGDLYIIVVSAISAYKSWLSVGLLLILSTTDMSGVDILSSILALVLAAAGAYYQLKKDKAAVVQSVKPTESEGVSAPGEGAAVMGDSAPAENEALSAASEAASAAASAVAGHMNNITEKASAGIGKVKEQIMTKVIPATLKKYESVKVIVLEKVTKFKNKFNEDKKFRVISVTIATVVVVVVGGLTIHASNPMTKFKNAYEDGDRYVARENYEKLNESKRVKAEELVVVKCNEVLDYFNNDELSFKTAENYLEYSQYVVWDESVELRGLVVDLYDLKESKDAYAKAGDVLKKLQLEDENSENCTELYNEIEGYLSDVVEYDTNYDKSVKLLNEAKNAYANNITAIAEQIVTTDDYEIAKNVVEKALEVLPEDVELLAALDSVNEKIAEKQEQEKVERELASLNRLQEKLEEKISGKVLSPVAPRTMVRSEFVSANLVTIGENNLWGLLICESGSVKLYVDNGERIVTLLEDSDAVSYTTSADGKLLIKVSDEYNTYSYDRTRINRYINKTYYTIEGINKITSEDFKYIKSTQGDNVTRSYYVEGTEIPEHEYNQREDLYKENAWTDIIILKAEDDFEVAVNTVEAVAAAQAEIEALIAERTN